mgnify:FL=1
MRRHGLKTLIRAYRDPSRLFLERRVPAGLIDLAFLDASHAYDDIREEFEIVSSRSSLVVLHDACQCAGVKRVVDEVRRSGRLVSIVPSVGANGRRTGFAVVSDLYR